MRVEINNKENGWSDVRFPNLYDKLDIGCRTLIDVGCKGKTIGHLRSKFNPKKIYGFEPYRPNYLECVARYRSDENVVVLELAASDEGGEAILYTNAEKPSNCTMKYGAKRKTSTTVETVRLDNWARANGVKDIDVVKIDTEGWEMHVLEGLGILVKDVKLFQIELKFTDNAVPYQDIINYLQPFGFELYGFTGLYFKEERLKWGDGVFVKKGLV